MRTFVIVLFGIVLTFGLIMDLSAQENKLTINSNSLFLYDNSFLNQNITFFSDTEESDDQGFSTGQRLGAGFMNILFGLGSFTMGDWRSGLLCLLFDVISIPYFVLSILIFSSTDDWMPFPAPWISGEVALDVLIFPFYCLVVAFWALPYVGIVSYPLNLVFKFYRPFVYQQPAPRTALVNDLRNWNVSFFPDTNGKVNGIISFTAHFN